MAWDVRRALHDGEVARQDEVGVGRRQPLCLKCQNNIDACLLLVALAGRESEWWY